ncbi:Ankyrin repeat-containing protein BDA1 [Cardamine amara subsp. amara]|uniref:Ankyrin repeat-containing protein BDA1 n=1 Tax=Cardamine amara subsp. amara TaxID=228776 RepID=A0ABD0ZAV6_CARAN
MDPRLAEAARSGNSETVYALLREDPYLLENIEAVPFIDTPLHEAVNWGESRFVMVIMNLKPSFARKLNPDAFSPLHLAVKQSRFRLVRQLLKADPSLAHVKGREGMTPLHLAVENGASELVVQFYKACPECIQDVNVDGQTALHIAVANGKMEVLEVLIGWLCRLEGRTAESIENKVYNKRDLDGNTVLHVAADKAKFQELMMLLELRKICKDIKNHNGLTAVDILKILLDTNKDGLLLESGAVEAVSVPKVTRMLKVLRLQPTRFQNIKLAFKRSRSLITDETRNALLVLSTLVMTATYQMVLQPPGGTNNGKVVMASRFYSALWVFNTVGFLAASFLVMFLLQVNAFKIMFYFPMFPCMCLAYLLSSEVISPSDAYVVKILPGFVFVILWFWVSFLVTEVAERISNSKTLRKLKQVIKVRGK